MTDASPSTDLATALEEWKKSASVANITVLVSEVGPPATLKLRFQNIEFDLFATQAGGGKWSEISVLSEEEHNDDVESWLTDVNTFLADKTLPLAVVFAFMERTVPPCQEDVANVNDDVHAEMDYEDDTEFDDQFLAESRYEDWCRARRLPSNLPYVGARFRKHISQKVRSASPVLMEAISAQSEISASGSWTAVTMSCVPELGLVQFAAAAVGGLMCSSAFAKLFGVEQNDVIVMAMVLADAALGLDGWSKDVSNNFATIHASIDRGRSDVDTETFVVSQLIPKLAMDYIQSNLKPRVNPNGARENLFSGVWPAISTFIQRATHHCLFCLRPHPGNSACARCYPCANHLCMFRHEEFLASVSIEIKRDVLAAELQLTLACAAVEEPSTFEPFPPHFLIRSGQRARAGIVDNPGSSGIDLEENKDIHAIRVAMAHLPGSGRLAALAKSGEAVVREALTASAYKLLRFILGSCPLTFQSLCASDHKPLPMLTSTEQFIVLQADPRRENEFKERSVRHGTRFAFHGSPLSRWYSIIRNGLRVFSDTGLMTSGRVHGAGVYLTKLWSTSVHYCKGFAGSNYKNSIGECLQVIGIFEYVNDPRYCKHRGDGEIIISDSDAVLLRYVVACRQEGGDHEDFRVDELNIRSKRKAAREAYDRSLYSGNNEPPDPIDLDFVWLGFDL